MALCTVTCSLQTVLGDVIQGNAALRFRLRNFAGSVPRVNGTAILIEPNRDVFPDADGNISTDLWGNDSITPANTFYSVDYINNGRVVATVNYLITGTTFDLDTHDPINPPSQKFPFPLVLETNGILNDSQILLNIVGAGAVTATQSNGTVTLTGTSPAAINTSVKYVVPDFITLGDSYAVPEGWIGAFQIGAVGSSTLTTIAATPSMATYLKNMSGTSAAGWAVGFLGCGSFGSSPNPITLGLVGSSLLKIALFTNTAVRNWIGLFDSRTITDVAFTNPTLNMCAFRYDTDAGDTHIMAVCQTDDTHQTLVSTGVAVPTDGSIHTYEVRTAQGVPGTVTFWIDGAQVASISTNVPDATVALNFIAYSETRLMGTAVSIGMNLASFQFFQ